VLKRWMGHGTRSVFEAWREVVKVNPNTELDQKKKIRKQQVEAQFMQRAEEFARVEASAMNSGRRHGSARRGARRWARLRKYRAALLRGHPARVCCVYATRARLLPFFCQV
jgi:hypothetical protein